MDKFSQKKVLIPALAVALALIVAGVTVGRGPAAMLVGIFDKIVQEVNRKSAEGGDWTTAKARDKLTSGDFIKTGEKSFAAIKLIDGSILRVREKSEVQLRGEKKEQALARNTHIGRGDVDFKVEKQENDQFTFSSPTSVASIRGTEGTFSNQDTVDYLILKSGSASFTNLISNNSVDVSGGQTGVSKKDGSIDSHTTTKDEKNILGSVGGGETPGKILEIEFKDKDGNIKKLKGEVK